MRVRLVIGVLLLCASPAAAIAQRRPGTPAEPSTYLGADLRSGLSSIEDVRGVSVGLGVLGAWAAHPHLELGGALDLRGGHLWSPVGQRGSGRVGLGLLEAWVGTGATLERLAGGARLVGALGSRALGLEGLDGGAPEGGLTLRLDGRWAAHRELEVTLTLHGGLWADGVVGPVGGGELDLVFLDDRARPFAGVVVLASGGVSPAVRPRLGGLLEVGRLLLALEVTVGLPGDPSGHLAGVTLTALRR